MNEQFNPRFADDVYPTDPDLPKTHAQLTMGPNGKPNLGDTFYRGGETVSQEMAGIQPPELEEAPAEDGEADAPSEGENA